MSRLNTSAEVLHDLRVIGYVDGADVPIGETTTDGFTFESQTEETALKAGTRKDAYLYIPGGTERTYTFALVNVSMENLVEAFGLNPSTRITGAGTVGNPYIATINPENYSETASRTWYAEGIREDAKIVRAEFLSAQIFSPQVTIKVTTGEPTNIPFRLRVLGDVKFKLWTPA